MTTITKIFKAGLVLMVLFAVTSCKKAANDRLSVDFEKYRMQNGLQVILHEDHSDPMISYAIMYHVGSGRETPGRTGFAHLFEHLLFMGSENVPTGKFDMVLEGMGASNNGGTSRDYTVYYEVFPKNALEKVFWLESDRMGFFINSVTPSALALQQNVVQNEKRQRVDNTPYGFTEDIIVKNLYPKGHPYSWTVIGEMEDLKNATLDDVRNFYKNYYGPNNATLVLAGDFSSDSIKVLIDKYFGEVKPHGEVNKRDPIVVTLEKTKKLFHEDNFANVPEITMVWPVPQEFHKDMYALNFLARILADGKKAPLYKVLVKEKQLTSVTNAYNSTNEIAGEFTISIRANEGKTLKEVEQAVFEAFGRFEKEGITEKDVERIKALSEKNFYEGLNGVFNKSLNLAYYNTMLDDPAFIEKDIENIKAVTLDDIIMVYHKYIKDKPYIATSLVPKGHIEMVADNSVSAEIKEENINEATRVEIPEGQSEEVIKTPSIIDRTTEPPAGEEPEVNLPALWKASLSNGIKVYGIQNKELPLVYLNITIEGGALQDKVTLPGVANMVANVLPQGTKNKTPEELEEEIELLGSSIQVAAGREEITMEGNMLSRNFEKTVSLIKEILLEPRWDSAEFTMALTRNKNAIIQAEAQPTNVASSAFYRLVYGTDNILGYSTRGTRESIDKISVNDLKGFYKRAFLPSLTTIHIAGNVSQDQVMAALEPLSKEWKGEAAQSDVLEAPDPVAPEKSVIFFADMPGSFQSVIYAGYPAIKRSDPDFVKADFVNYRLGGAYTSILNQILREQKGFTYGASSSFREMKSVAPFIAATSVRSDATFESVKIIREEMERYRKGISTEDLQFVKNYLIRSNALRFETNDALVGMLATMSKYGFSDDYIKKEEAIIRNMTLDDANATILKYIVPDRMYYVVVGDAASQMKALEKIGFGKPVLIPNK
ncbi:MAG TPA: pitrilysin family protein [Bacteroidales bacterium]|jgi:zinc protease|nr:MAG: Peptidase M16 inactive domain protein [Bacteroidetes bacterium ADurb.Bin145]HOU01333.1 pitrilysin family protein [Bacteroidales bacterium]HQK67416.1 pitrilysin family protein [Bacteroidales bacterium]